MLNVLVTGADGQLGRTLKELSSEYLSEINFIFTTKVELDITQQKGVEEILLKNKFDYCVNCAAYTNVEQAEKTPEIAYKVNAEAVKYLAETCKKSDTTLIHISTDYVFDGKKNHPYTEEDGTNPINEYGRSKLLGEQYIRQILDNYFIIRASWLYSSYGKNFLKTVVDKINKGENLKITTSQKGTPTSCMDLASFIVHIITTEEDKFGIYHFSAHGEATWYDFALQISKHLKQLKYNNIQAVETYTANAKRPEYSVLDNSKSQCIYSNIKDWKMSTKEIVNCINM